MKTVIPAEAHAKLDMRLVPNQDPRRILECLRRHLDARGFTDVELVKTLASESAWWTPVSHPLAEAAARASEEIFGMPAIRITSSMSTAPMYQVCSPHRLPVEVLDELLERFVRLNPLLRAYLALNDDDARQTAMSAERAWRSSGEKPLLCGVPVSIKDTIVRLPAHARRRDRAAT